MFRDILDVFSVIDPILAGSYKSRFYSKAYCPSVVEVIDNKPTTVVKFSDGSKAVVKCSENDEYNLETAVIYALVKRTFCTEIKDDGEAVCAGLGNSLKRILEKAKVAKTSKNWTSSLPTETKQKITVKAPVIDTSKSFGFKCPLKKTSKIASVLASQEYDPCVTVKTSKKKSFKHMTQEEKRAYWREQKRKARNRK